MGKWPAFFAFVCLRSLVTKVLMVSMLVYTDESAAVYFWSTYWYAAALAGAIEVWMIIEMACAVMSGYPRFCGLMQRLIPAIALIYLVVSVSITQAAPLPFSLYVTRVVVTGYRATTLTWLITFLSLVYASDFLGVQWIRFHRLIAFGFCLLVISDAATGWLVGMLVNPVLLTRMHDAAFIASLATWIVAFVRKYPVEKVPDLERLRDALKTVQDAVPRSRP